MSDETQTDDEVTGGGKESQAANLFDLRRILGGLFIVYGLILTIVGLFDTSSADITKSAGVHVNLVAGLGMLVLGGLFLLWGFLRPLDKQLAELEAQEQGQEEAERKAQSSTT